MTHVGYAEIENPQEAFPVDRFLLFYGITLDEKSYLVKAARALPMMSIHFTVPQLSEAAGIPRSKGYPTIKQLDQLKFVEKVPKVRRPSDWGDYTRTMRKRFNREHGLPIRGTEPRRYRFTPSRAVVHARSFLNSRVLQIEREACERISELNGIYSEILNSPGLPF